MFKSIKTSSQVKYKKKKRFSPHSWIYFLSVGVILISSYVYFNLMVSIENEVFTVETRISHKDSFELKRIKEYDREIKLSQINQESHDEIEQEEEIVDSSSTDTFTDKVNESLDNSNVPKGHSFKSFTYYTSLSEHSPQGQLQKIAYTDENGLRKVDEYYCAALGSYYGQTVGDKFIVTTSTGNQFKIILCDVKSDWHTNSTHQYTVSNGCVIEFYVDKARLVQSVRISGDISSIKGFEGEILSIVKE